MSVALPGVPLTMAIIAADMLSDDPPPTEATLATPGTAPKARRRDSRSARITSMTQHVTTAGGITRCMFTRKFTRMPGVFGSLIEATNNGPSDCKVVKYVNAAGLDWNSGADQTVEANQVAGCDLYWYRIRALPTMSFTPLTLVTFLFGTVNSIFTSLFSALSGYNPYEPVAADVMFTCIAVASSEPAP